MTKKTSYEWFEMTGIDWRGLDPDGWDRSRLFEHFSQPISAREFADRLSRCTFTGMRGMTIDKSQRARDILKALGYRV